ncbi:GH25 family lysozyme [Ruminococcus sp.]|uniref:GH25 family lysozyme n=1 Tax=Ruminococcus sp. TaxID=41978 RepID=UPI0025DFD276|nr:GH25 family lysozyme [Ruminococcus sp.]
MAEYSYEDNPQLSAHFRAREFRCKCSSPHTFQVSERLISMLEQLYTALDCGKIIVNSGYRCAVHDKAVGGNGAGQHTKGTAADVVCYDKSGGIISAKMVCCKAQDLGFTGIANITSAYTAVHLDVRTGSRYYGDETKGTNTVTSDFYRYFGIAKSQQPSGIVAKGIDVSKHQGVINWEKVKASGMVEFAILRAGYGKESSQIDQQFARNYSECKRLGIPIGAYWYSYAKTAAEAEQEAAVCLSALKGKQFEYPVAFDIEEKESLQNADALCQVFCGALEKAGYYAAIYTFKSALESCIGNNVKSRYDVFLSHVDVSKSSYTGNYGLWQYSWKGSVSGIVGDLDLDYAYRDYPAIIKNAGLNGFAKNATDKPNEDTKKDTSDDDTLKHILQHVASIDGKLNG